MHNYCSKTGQWTLPDGRIYNCYSGHGEGRNNPDMEGHKGVGPIPRGMYRIGKPRNSERTGRYIMDLFAVGHDCHGRDAFQLHGNNKTNDASNGCIILSPRQSREEIWNTGDTELEVT